MRQRRLAASSALACVLLLCQLLPGVSSAAPKYQRPPAYVLERIPQEIAPKTSSAEAPKDAGEEKTVAKALDRRFRYNKKRQSEFGIYGGDYLGDEWYNTWDIGARYYFYFNNAIGLGAEYLYSPIRADSSGDFGKSLTTDRTHTLFGALSYNNAAAFEAGGIVECDLMLTLGAGAMQINHSWEYAIVIGGGMKIYTPAPWFAVRFDVNSYLHPTPKPTGDAFNADLVINLGLSFLFPTKRAEEQPAVDTPEDHNIQQ